MFWTVPLVLPPPKTKYNRIKEKRKNKKVTEIGRNHNFADGSRGDAITVLGLLELLDGNGLPAAGGRGFDFSEKYKAIGSLSDLPNQIVLLQPLRLLVVAAAVVGVPVGSVGRDEASVGVVAVSHGCRLSYPRRSNHSSCKFLRPRWREENHQKNGEASVWTATTTWYCGIRIDSICSTEITLQSSHSWRQKKTFLISLFNWKLKKMYIYDNKLVREWINTEMEFFYFI